MNVAGSYSRVERFRFVAFDAKDAPAPTPGPVPASTATEIAILPPDLPEQSAPPPVPTFTLEQLEAEKREAFERGIAEGKTLAEKSQNKLAAEQASATLALLQVIANRIALAGEDQQRFLKNQHQLVLNLSLGIARKVAGDALKREPLHSVEKLIKDCFELFAGNERIAIFVAPQRYEGLKLATDTLRPLLKDFKGELVIEGDETITENDCRIEWKSGAAEFNAERLWNEIEQVVRKTPLSS